MSRCEHGEQITIFCINESCPWRESGGCQTCLKKYHPHPQTSMDVISIEKLEDSVKAVSVSHDLKPKSKALQQVVSNYFIIMKSQISTSIDALSRSLYNKLTYPYLNSQGYLNVVRKIKNKQLKKINKKQLKSFCDFVETQNKELVEFNQKKIYLHQVQQLSKLIKSLNQIFIAYSKTVQKIDNSFNIQRSYFNKINQMCQSISAENSQKGKVEEKSQKNDKVSSSNTFTSTEKQKQKKDGNQEKGKRQHPIFANIIGTSTGNSGNNVNPIVKKNSRDRKVSLDYGMGLEVGKFKPNANQNQNIDQNQKQILQKKKKLFDMLNNPQGYQSQKQNKLTQKTQQSKQQINESPQNAKVNTQQKQTPQKPTQPRQDPLAQNQVGEKNTAQLKTQQRSPDQYQSNNLFEELMSKGINLPEILIAHTTLPRQASRQKLCEDSRDVKERKITIPVKKFQQEEENYSPILKKKRQNKIDRQQSKQQANQMGKVSLFGNKEEKDEIKQQQKQEFETPKKQKQEQKLLLKEKQADSLALLIESLHLPADKAIPLLQAALKFAHNNLSAAEYLSYLYLQVEKPRNCLQLCNKILQQIEDSPQCSQLSVHISNNKAAALNLLGRYSESIPILQKCLAYTKKDIYYKNLGDSYFSISIYQKAALNYQNALKLNNKMDQAYYNLAVCYYMQNHMHQAKFNIEKALKINPRNQNYLALGREVAAKMQF